MTPKLSVALAGMLLGGASASAQSLAECPRTQIDRTGSEMAQDTWPLALEKLLDVETRDHTVFGATVILPYERADGSQCLATQTLHHFARDEGGTVWASIVPSSRAYGYVLGNRDRVPVEVTSVMDWSYAPDFGGPVYGKFAPRALDETERTRLYQHLLLSEQPLPSAWRE